MAKREERGTGRISRRIVPRNKDSYSNAKDGMSAGLGVRANDKCFNTKAHNLRVIYPNSDSFVFFRPFAALDPTSEKPKLLPGRESMEAFGQSQWIVRVPICKYVGTVERHRVSYVIHGPGQAEQRNEDPYVVLYNAMYRAKERGEVGRGRWRPEWAKLLANTKRELAKITPPDFIWVTQGLCYAAGDKVYVSERGRSEPLGAADEDPLTVLTLSSGAGRNLLRLLDTPRRNIEEVDEVDLDRNYLYGSAVGDYDEASGTLKGGLIIGVFRPNNRTSVENLPPFNPAKKSTVVTSFDGKLGDIIGYEVSLHRAISLDRTLYSSSLSAEQTDANFNKAQFFFGDEEHDDGIIKVHSLEQKLEFLALAFSDMPGVLRFGWFGRDDFFTPEVEKILRKSVTSVSPLGDEEENEDEGEDEERQSKRVNKSSASKSPIAGRSRVHDELEEDDEELDDELEEDEDDFEDMKRSTRSRKPAKSKDGGRRVLSKLDEFDEDDEPEFSVGEREEDDDFDEDEDDLDEDEDKVDAKPAKAVASPSKKKSGRKVEETEAARLSSVDATQKEFQRVFENISDAAAKAEARSSRRAKVEEPTIGESVEEPSTNQKTAGKKTAGKKTAGKKTADEEPPSEKPAGKKSGGSLNSSGGTGRRRRK